MRKEGLGRAISRETGLKSGEWVVASCKVPVASWETGLMGGKNVGGWRQEERLRLSREEGQRRVREGCRVSSSKWER